MQLLTISGIFVINFSFLYFAEVKIGHYKTVSFDKNALLTVKKNTCLSYIFVFLVVYY